MGSSSLKFETFRLGGALGRAATGIVEEFDGRPRFHATGADGRALGEHTWEQIGQ